MAISGIRALSAFSEGRSQAWGRQELLQSVNHGSRGHPHSAARVSFTRRTPGEVALSFPGVCTCFPRHLPVVDRSLPWCGVLRFKRWVIPCKEGGPRAKSARLQRQLCWQRGCVALGRSLHTLLYSLHL